MFIHILNVSFELNNKKKDEKEDGGSRKKNYSIAKNHYNLHDETLLNIG